MNRHWLRVLAVLSLAAGLSACVVSKDALFDPKDAVTPISPGRFEVEDYDFKTDSWGAKKKAATLELRDRRYVLVSKQDNAADEIQEFNLFDIGGGFLVAAMFMEKGYEEERGPEYYYELLQKNGDEILNYSVRCENLVHIRLPVADRPTVEGAKDADETNRYCKFSSRDKLIAALLAYAKVMLPTVRYKPVKG